jgi:hypothetical protein
MGNMTDLPGPEAALLRRTLVLIGDAADPPWWVWTVAFALLAAANATVFWLARRTERPAEGFFLRCRRGVYSVCQVAVPLGSAVRRLANTVHVALLLVVLVGVAAPSTVGSIVGQQLAARYIVAYQRDFEARAQTAGYEEVYREIAAAGPAERADLRTRLIHFYRIISAESPTDNAAAAYAHRVGVDQAADLKSGQGNEGPAGNRRTTYPVMPDPQAPDVTGSAKGGLGGQLVETEAEESAEKGDSVTARRAGQSAVAAVSSIISSYTGNAATTIVQEYVSGLVEEGPLEDVVVSKLGEAIGGIPAAGVEAEFSPDTQEIDRAVSEEDALGSRGAGIGPSGGSDDDPDVYRLLNPMLTQQDDEGLDDSDDDSGG